MNLENFMKNIENRSKIRIDKIHHLAKLIWKRHNLSVIEVRNKCLDIWEEMEDQLGTKINPLVRVYQDRKPTNLIFGSGSFSTGNFQATQYKKIEDLLGKSPIKLQGIVANKSLKHGCYGSEVAKKHNLPLIELDFIDWYHNHINKDEQNPIRATRYWFNDKETNKPSKDEIRRRFDIRQNQFHKDLGNKIKEKIKEKTDIVSLRGYNFQVCNCIFNHQDRDTPHYNDTHPADLSYIEPNQKFKLYAGWQSGAVKKMMENKIHKRYRGSFIEVKNMDNIDQINELDEGVLLGIGEGVQPPKDLDMTADQIQNAIKIIDDYFFCTWEASGLILFFGVTKDPIPIVYQTIEGKKISLNQRGVIVGDKVRSGIDVWGQNLEKDFNEIKNFLLN